MDEVFIILRSLLYAVYFDLSGTDVLIFSRLVI